MNRYVLGNNIKDTLNKIGKTQSWLAEYSGISTNYISQIVCGKRTPSASHLYKIAKSMGCTMDSLMKGVLDDEYYVFTFGHGQKYDGCYVKVKGTYGSARQKMFDKYGEEWAFQYSMEEWEEWERTRPPYIPVEKELEVIE